MLVCFHADPDVSLAHIRTARATFHDLRLGISSAMRKPSPLRDLSQLISLDILPYRWTGNAVLKMNPWCCPGLMLFCIVAASSLAVLILAVRYDAEHLRSKYRLLAILIESCWNPREIII
ncbi:hypothetical protein LX32DRAFT_338136 [Colletotrichum zoysiae]|uniref:Uncharacterized protein n=1 Tax=Colletotrichum zoysiae TaxID=1216348 RepID=A0AAD9HJ39_9PEZI|nr:hypothetical protein LX32DRAFT_338136 [Colletotrichum zoysiae]